MVLKKIFQVKNDIKDKKFYKKIILLGFMEFNIRLNSYIKKGNEVLIKRGGNLFPYKNKKGLTLICKGKGNRIVIEEPIEFSGCFISLSGNENTVEIKKSEHILFNFSVYADSNSKLNVGGNFSCASVDISLRHSKGVKIGEDCMCSDGVMILANDGHPIVDAQTGEVLNEGGTIEIGNHVWLGRKSIICKNTKIADNSIVGTRAVVTKEFNEENVALAGIPAKIVKQNINWKREF